MLVLFAISVLCLCAVLWSAVSIARHVLQTQQRRRRPARAPQQGLVEVFFDDKMQQLGEHAAMTHQAAASRPAFAWETLPARQRATAALEESAVLFEPPVQRKSPQPAAAGAPYRADWDYFNKDLGDLTDPYETNQRERSEVRSASLRY